MRKLALAALLLAGCSKKDAEPSPHVVQGPTAAASDPTNLPPAGTAPPAATVDKELDPMWNAAIKTL